MPKAPLPRRHSRPLAREAKKMSWGSTCQRGCSQAMLVWLLPRLRLSAPRLGADPASGLLGLLASWSGTEDPASCR